MWDVWHREDALGPGSPARATPRLKRVHPSVWRCSGKRLRPLSPGGDVHADM